MTQVEQVERRSGRPRSEDADKAIIDATLDLLAEVGIAPLTIEGVAAKAGVGKTTVYRRWPNKDALIVDAMAALKGPPPELKHESFRDDLRAMLLDQMRGKAALRSRRIYACFMSDSARHPALNKRYKEVVLEPRSEAMRRSVEAAQERGEIRDDLDPELVVHLVRAPVLTWSVANLDEPMDIDLMERFFDAILEGVAQGPTKP